MRLKKFIRQIHLWLGLASGLIVFIIGVTGCLLVFENELKNIFYKERTNVAILQNSKKLPIAELKKIVDKVVPEKYPLNSVIVPNKEGKSYVFRSRYKDDNALTYFGQMEYYHQIYINPYNGKILKNENGEFEFFHFVTWLHIGLLLSYDVGTKITSIAVSMFIILLITGIYLWWPRKKNSSKTRFSFKWKKTTGFKRKNYDLHNILGFYASFLLLIIAITGLVWSFEWVGSSLQWIANGGEIIKTEEKSRQYNSTITLNTDSLNKVHEQLATVHPHAQEYYISFPKDSILAYKSSTKIVEDNSYNSIANTFNVNTYKLESESKFEDLSRGEKLNEMNLDIHTGAIYGLVGKLVAFFASLIAASLPVTGFLVWIGRKNKKSAVVVK